MRSLRTVLRASVVVVLVCAIQGCRAPITPVTSPASVASANQAYQKAFRLWSQGKQDAAEALLGNEVLRYPENQRLLFFQAACVRSRFEIEKSFPLFVKVVQMNRDSVEGRCANHVGNLDLGKNVEKHFAGLLQLVKQNPNDPLPLWLLAIECRANKRNEEGVHYFAKLMTMVETGSALVHQTYANLLDEVGQHKESLVHRKMAVQLEPADWSYEGLANTERAIREQKENPLANLIRQPNLPEAERRAIYRKLYALSTSLLKTKYKGHMADDVPELVAFRKRHHITSAEANWINAEGEEKRWYFTPEQRRRAGLPP